ncbi:hypothetical protein Salat_2619100 [Sesamum alatum]|uniref:Uncharacterized protein n=1 Tax=Sesamum alatum TaxID=300844 RepID=A0AAE1XNK4_9LAMI|nr:hypothetical protein Salat_2619100 [Sesamum alatum]
MAVENQISSLLLTKGSTRCVSQVEHLKGFVDGFDRSLLDPSLDANLQPYVDDAPPEVEVEDEFEALTFEVGGRFLGARSQLKTGHLFARGSLSCPPFVKMLSIYLLLGHLRSLKRAFPGEGYLVKWPFQTPKSTNHGSLCWTATCLSQQHTLRRLQLPTYPPPLQQPPHLSPFLPPPPILPRLFAQSIVRPSVQAMGRKAVSVADALHMKKKPILKRSSSRRKQLIRTAFKKVFNYMKSDTYMFAPLLYPQHPRTSSSVSFGEVVELFEPIKKELGKDVEEYLRCDCYMYSPLFLDSNSRILGDAGRGKRATGATVCDEMEPGAGQRRRQDQNNMNSLKETDYSYNAVMRFAVKHIVHQKENVKHLVKRNYRPSSSPGKVPSQKESRKITVE